MDPTRVLAQLERILTSAVFVDAQRARSFLRFIVARTLDGRTSEIKESTIAIEVLGRSPSFDSKTDPIVRVEAARLRDRLRDYYDRHARADDVFISVPKGAYVPQFVEREPQTPLQNVLRLSILPPAGTDFESFAISPDGRRIAFTAQADGTLRLWVRELDSLDARPLPGTETAAFPFWSPDSRSIGFFTPFKLKVVPASGGPCRELADVVVGRGAAWNAQGIIVFCPRPVGPLYRIAAEGGTPTPVTTLETERSEIAHGFPQFLPDGRRFIYFATSCRPGESSIRIGSLDSATSTIIVESETSALYAPVFRSRSGCLLFVSHNAMLAQPLDLQTLERRGRPEIVAPEVRYRPWGQASMSISNDGLLLYRGGTNENHQFTWIGVRVRPSPRSVLAIDWDLANYSFNLSPDGKRVAIHRTDDPDTALPTIWVMDLYRGGTLWRFTEPGGQDSDFCPVWDANGAELAFSRGDYRCMRVLRRPLSGGTPISIVDTQGPKFPTDWSADGSYVVYNSQEPDYRYQHLWIASMHGESHLLLPQTYYAGGSARFAPAVVDGRPRWLAYTSNETGRYEDLTFGVFRTGRTCFRSRTRAASCRSGDVTGASCSTSIWTEPSRRLAWTSPRRVRHARRRVRDGAPPDPYSMWMNQYAVANDGQSFLFNRPVEQPDATITALLPR